MATFSPYLCHLWAEERHTRLKMSLQSSRAAHFLLFLVGATEVEETARVSWGWRGHARRA